MNAPTDSSSSSSNAGQRPRRRGQLWLLIALFFAPLALAFLLYYGAPGGWRPAGSTNHGDLIEPPRPLPEVTLPDATGADLPPSLLRGKWTLILVGDGRCNPVCHEALTLMRQTRLALNNDMGRVQRLFLATGNCCDRAYLDAEHSGLITAQIDNPAGKTLMAQFPADQGRIYVVDPLGNLMMSHAVPAAGADPAASRGLLKDLKKLLKLSHIG